MTSLPIDAHLSEIVELVRASRALVLVAEPGAGKTTRVPPALLGGGVLSADHPNLVMLQPRRGRAGGAISGRLPDPEGGGTDVPRRGRVSRVGHRRGQNSVAGPDRADGTRGCIEPSPEEGRSGVPSGRGGNPSIGAEPRILVAG